MDETLIEYLRHLKDIDIANEFQDVRKRLYDIERVAQFKQDALTILSANPSFQLLLPNLSANPSTGTEGALAVVGGKLKIYHSSAWVVVGTQT